MDLNVVRSVVTVVLLSAIRSAVHLCLERPAARGI